MILKADDSDFQKLTHVITRNPKDVMRIVHQISNYSCQS